MTDILTTKAGPVVGFAHANGRSFEIREVWVCACSGDGHPVGEPNAKCFRKGGEWRSDLFESTTGEWAGWWVPEDDRERLVRDHGWQELDGDGFLLRPQFAEAK